MAESVLTQGPKIEKPIDFSAIRKVDKLTTPVVEELPGIGTVTRTPKNPAPVPAATGVGDNAAGLYERTGVTPPPTLPPGQVRTPSGAVVDEKTGALVSGPTNLPAYGGTQQSASTRQSSVLEAYESLVKSIDDIETRIKSNASAGAEELALSKQLAAKKSQLADFDLDTLKRVESLYGQGRGRTLSNIGLQETQERRTRALERLGIANEAQVLVDELAIAQDARKGRSQAAQTEYNLASKRLDIALGVQRELKNLDDDEKRDARQYLLDIVDFAEGKTYDQLDQATQQGVMQAVANSPITLDMVKTALRRGSQDSKNSELLTVAEANALNVPYGTTRREAFGITPQTATEAEGGGYGNNPGGYTKQELRRIREAGIDSIDTQSADRYLYGDGAARGLLTVPQLNAIADAYYQTLKQGEDSSGNPVPYENVDSLKKFLNNLSYAEVNDKKVILSDIQKDAMASYLDQKKEEERGFFSKIGTGFMGLLRR